MTTMPKPPTTDRPAEDDTRGLAVVVTAHAEERWSDTKTAVDSALAQKPAPDEVILVVDHNPKLADLARSVLHGVTVLENVGPRGASAARNTGAANTSSDIVVFLDDDQRPTTERWLAALCRHFDEPDVVGVGGGITPAWTGHRPTWFPREFDWVVGASYTGMPDSVAPIRNVWGGNTAIRRSAFEAVHGFRVGFGKIGEVSRPEDTDLCLRIGQALPSSFWLYDPLAEVAHTVPANRCTFRFFLRRCWNEGRGKAALARFVGAEISMSSERTYATQVLPAAFWRELRTAVAGADVACLQRCTAIVAGAVLTGAGWLAELAAGIRHGE